MPEKLLVQQSLLLLGAFTDDELMELASSHDAGFDRGIFALQLRLATRLNPRRVERYEVPAEAVPGIQERLFAWADSLASGS